MFISSEDVQVLHDRFNCTYFVKVSFADVETLSSALRCPFYKVYVLGNDKKQVEFARRYFEDNTRIQVFHRTHDGSFFEIVRMVPSGYSSMFLLEGPAEVIQQQLTVIASTRPSRRDVLIIKGAEAPLLDNIGKFFGYTHRVEMLNDTILVLPNKARRAISSIGVVA